LIYEFAGPVSGTYPLWYDLSYWHDGVKVRFNWHAQGVAVLEGLRRYQLIWFNTFRQLNFTLVVLIIFALCPSARFFRTIFSLWPLWIVGASALAMYALVAVEFRYVAPFVLLIWLAIFSGLEHPRALSVGRVIPVLVAGICTTTLVLALLWTWLSRTPDAGQYPVAASALLQAGLEAGSRLAVIGVDPAGRDGAYVARLGRMKIVAELRNPDAYWNAPSVVREHTAENLRGAGAEAIIANHASTLAGWVRLGNTEYSLYLLRKPN
jgi:hypothetical protein